MIKTEIQNLRNRIDEIDEKIAKLLSERVDCAIKIGSLKDKLRNSSENEKIEAYDPLRENQIIEHLKTKFNSIPLNGIELIFRQIISLCRNSAHKATVCVLGEKNEFDYKQHFGNFCQYVLCPNLSSFVKEMNKDKFSIGVVIGDTNGKNIQELESNNFKLIDTFANKSKTIQVVLEREEKSKA